MREKPEHPEQDRYRGHDLILDHEARSADPSLPAFLARPNDAPVYHGFPLVPETSTDGWTYGAISDFADPDGCEDGDGYVVAPDGTRAGLVWSVGTFPTKLIDKVEPDRWGVYSIAFPRPVRSVDDLVFCFRVVLPELQALHRKARRRRWWQWFRR